MGQHRFPTTNRKIASYFRKAIPHLETNKVRLGINLENMAILDTSSTKFYTNINLCESNDTKTTTTILLKNEGKEETIAILRTIYSDIPESAFTAQDRVILRIKKRETDNTPIALVDFEPALSIEEIRPGFHKLRIKDSIDPATKAMPYGHNVEVQKAFISAEVATILWITVGMASRFLYKVNFNDEDKGKKVQYRGRYVNTRGQQGNWSRIVSEIVI